MKNSIAAALLFCFLFLGSISAQTGNSTANAGDERPLGGWSVAVFAGGGTGLVDRTNVQMVRGGFRIAKVLTRQRKAGSLEVGSEFAPVDYVLWSGYKNVYGFSANPVIVKWDFPVHGKLAPFFVAQGGLIRTNVNIPPGDTSQINFTSGGGLGMNILTRPNRAITFDVRAIHLSNASIGNHNPGINASLQFSLAYTWIHR